VSTNVTIDKTLAAQNSQNPVVVMGTTRAISETNGSAVMTAAAGLKTGKRPVAKMNCQSSTNHFETGVCLNSAFDIAIHDLPQQFGIYLALDGFIVQTTT
jgi:hypothetical protein